MKISVCMIVKNEEAQLPRALASIPENCEVIVLDTGSTDKTTEIATNHGANVYHAEWKQDFADARNTSISHANGEYVFILDADEVLDDNWYGAITEHVLQYPATPAAVKIRNVTEKEETIHLGMRFFPNNSLYRFKGKVHEQLYFNDQPAEFKRSSIQIHHYGYTEQQMAVKDKLNRYVALYQEHLQASPDDGYMLYQLGKLYYSVGKHQEAYEPLIQSVLLEQTNHLYYPSLLVTLGYTLQALNLSQNAFEMLEPFCDMYPSHPDLPFLMGSLAMDTGLVKAIEHYFKRALETGETDRYTTVAGCGSYRAAHNLGAFYEVTGNGSWAKEYYSIAAKMGFEPSILRLRELS